MTSSREEPRLARDEAVRGGAEDPLEILAGPQRSQHFAQPLPIMELTLGGEVDRFEDERTSAEQQERAVPHLLHRGPLEERDRLGVAHERPQFLPRTVPVDRKTTFEPTVVRVVSRSAGEGGRHRPTARK